MVIYIYSHSPGSLVYSISLPWPRASENAWVCQHLAEEMLATATRLQPSITVLVSRIMLDSLHYQIQHIEICQLRTIWASVHCFCLRS